MPEHKQAQYPEGSRQQRILNRADAEILEIMGAVKHAADNDHFKMPEQMFKEVFMPLFAGKKVMDPKVNMGLYVSVVGNPFRKVDVIDQTEKVLFTVPPLCNRETVRAGFGIGVQSFNEIMANHGLLAQTQPAMADGYLFNEIQRKNILQYDTEEGRKEAAIWNDIFVRYGYDAPFKIAGVPELNGGFNTPPVMTSLGDNGFDNSGFE